jgi:hypothetical protein
MVWLIGIAYALFGILISFGARQLELRKDITGDFGMQEKAPKKELQETPRRHT